jgi:YidC/Oxa1 family membrane protein insertase
MTQERESEQRIWLAVALSVVVYFGWTTIFPPPRPTEPPPTDVAVESAPAPATGAAEPAVVAPPVEATVEVPERSIPFQDADYSGVIRSRDGALSSTSLTQYHRAWHVTPFWTFLVNKVLGRSTSWEPYERDEALEEVLGPDASYVIAGTGRPGPDEAYLVESSGSTVTARRTLANGLTITKTYVPGGDGNRLEVTVDLANGSDQPLDGVWVGVAASFVPPEGQYANHRVPVVYADGDLEKLDSPEDATTADGIDGPVEWLGYADRYFLSVLAPKDVDPLAHAEFRSLPDGRVGSFVVDPRPLQPGETRTLRFLGYLGPKDLRLLEPLGSNLDESVEFGFFGFFAKILLSLLKWFERFVGNWGIAIIVLTVLVKTLFYPLTAMQYLSSKKMQALKPKLDAIKEQYKDNAQLQSQETMKLFQQEKVNPTMGCLLPLIQIPVWFALYSVLLNSVELYDSSFLYLRDLTQVDPYGLFPTIASVLMIVLQRMMPMTGLDPTQQKIIQAMPFVFAIFMYTFPSGLAVYISVNNMLSVAQQWYMNRRFKTSESPVLA